MEEGKAEVEVKGRSEEKVRTEELEVMRLLKLAQELELLRSHPLTTPLEAIDTKDLQALVLDPEKLSVRLQR